MCRRGETKRAAAGFSTVVCVCFFGLFLCSVAHLDPALRNGLLRFYMEARLRLVIHIPRRPIPTEAHPHLGAFPLRPIPTEAHSHVGAFPLRPVPTHTHSHLGPVQIDPIQRWPTAWLGTHRVTNARKNGSAAHACELDTIADNANAMNLALYCPV